MVRHDSKTIDKIFDHLTIRARSAELEHVWRGRQLANEYAASMKRAGQMTGKGRRVVPESIYAQIRDIVCLLLEVAGRDHPEIVAHHPRQAGKRARTQYTRRDPLDGLNACTCSQFWERRNCYHSRKQNVFAGITDWRDALLVGPWRGQLREVHSIEIRKLANGYTRSTHGEYRVVDYWSTPVSGPFAGEFIPRVERP